MGIWKVGGEIDYEVLDDICDLAIDLDGRKVLTREILDMQSTYRYNTNLDYKGWGIATVVYYGYSPVPIPISWSRVTSGSFDELFKYVGDIEGNTDAISVERFRQFYENNDQILNEIKID